METTNIIHKFFLNESMYEVQMIQYERLDVSEGIDINKTGASK